MEVILFSGTLLLSMFGLVKVAEAVSPNIKIFNGSAVAFVKPRGDFSPIELNCSKDYNHKWSDGYRLFYDEHPMGVVKAFKKINGVDHVLLDFGLTPKGYKSKRKEGWFPTQYIDIKNLVKHEEK